MRKARTTSFSNSTMVPYASRVVRASLTGGNGKQTVDDRLKRLEELIEKLQSALDTQFGRTAAIQAELDALKASLR